MDTVCPRSLKTDLKCSFTRGPRIGEGGPSVRVDPEIIAMLSADATDLDEYGADRLRVQRSKIAALRELCPSR